MCPASTSDLRAAAVTALLALAAACTPPPSVKAVDTFLTAYANKDADAMAAATWPGDRALVRDCLAALETSPTSTLALALPPFPLSHEVIEIEDKPAEDRHVVLVRVTMKNPLAYEAKRVGQDLGDFPKTRNQRRRFLSVREGDRWGVKLDLAAVLRRAEFVAEFTRLLTAKDFAAAEALLAEAPPPPDEANAQLRKDRLVTDLEAELAETKRRLKVKTSSTSTSAQPTR